MILDSLSEQRLTRQQYIGVLGQEYHLSLNAPPNLRAAAEHLEPRFSDLALWLKGHAADEDGHHLWALADLSDLGASVPEPSEPTQRLLTRIREVAHSRESYRILGLSHVVEHTAPKIDPAKLLPEGLGSATRFVVRHTKVDVIHAQEVDQAIAGLPADCQTQVWAQREEFMPLFIQFLLSAAGLYPPPATGVPHP